MKILCVTTDGDGMPLALNLKKEGNDVRIFIKPVDFPDSKDTYKGIMETVPDWKPHLEWCDYVCFFNNKLTDIWEQCHKVKPCFGGSTAGHKLEKDRSASHKLMESISLKSPESITVKTIQEVERHLKEHKVLHVLKFTGGDTDSADVFIGEYEDNRDLIRLAHMVEDQGTKWDGIEIEERIDGVEVGVEGYFDGSKFAPGVVVTFEHKRFASGNKGQGWGFLTGEMGSVLKFTDNSNAFFKRTLEKMTPFLKSIDYRGEIHAGFISNKKGDWFLEHGPRKGYPDCVIRLECQVTPEGELYYQIAKGNVTKNEYLSEWAMGLVVVVPGFGGPEEAANMSEGIPIFGYKENEKHCHLFEARKRDDEYEVDKGGCGYPLVVTGHGKTLEEAMKNTWWILDPRNPDRVFVPKGWPRSDVGERVMRERDQIISLGILTKEEFYGQK